MSWNEEARIRCRLRFNCPQVWDRLQPTGLEGIRHCPECERDVHLALTEEDFRRHSDEGRCIAVRVLRNDRKPIRISRSTRKTWQGRLMTRSKNGSNETRTPMEAGVTRKGGSGAMDPRTMNRRNLCKTIAVMVFAGLSSPLKHLAAAEMSRTLESNKAVDEVQKDERKIFVCACWPKLPNGGITFLRKSNCAESFDSNI